jgi:hypothetical protein
MKIFWDQPHSLAPDARTRRRPPGGATLPHSKGIVHRDIKPGNIFVIVAHFDTHGFGLYAAEFRTDGAFIG